MRFLGWILAWAFWVGAVFFQGLTVSLLWHWYIVPLNVNEVSVVQGAGISFLVSVLKHSYTKTKSEDVLADFIIDTLDNIIFNAIALASGYLLYQLN